MNFVSHCIHRNVLQSPDTWAMAMSRDPICVMYEFSTLVTFVGDVVGAGIFSVWRQILTLKELPSWGIF